MEKRGETNISNPRYHLVKKVPSRPVQQIIDDFDRIARLPYRPWSPNSHYHNRIVNMLPEGCNRVLEVGCGRGELSKKLRTRSRLVFGVDVSSEMINQAEIRLGERDGIFFQCTDYLEKGFPVGHFDCVVSVATLHHLPIVQFMEKVKRELSPGGLLIIVDLYRATSPLDYMLAALSIPLAALMRITRNRMRKVTRGEKRLWRDHGRRDTYHSIGHLKTVCGAEFSSYKLQRLFFWRYLLVCQKEHS